ncbi:hypothetical protein [Shewanella sp. UCD-KL12]|nr:hypothetical protein [Shewanella sp. UCD-KL12]
MTLPLKRYRHAERPHHMPIKMNLISLKVVLLLNYSVNSSLYYVSERYK